MSSPTCARKAASSSLHVVAANPVATRRRSYEHTLRFGQLHMLRCVQVDAGGAHWHACCKKQCIAGGAGCSGGRQTDPEVGGNLPVTSCNMICLAVLVVCFVGVLFGVN